MTTAQKTAMDDQRAAQRLMIPGQLERAENLKRLAFWIACAALALAFVPWVVIWDVSSRSHIQPHIVVVDPEGAVLWHGPAGAYQIEDAWVATQVQRWIKLVRRRGDDQKIMADDRREVEGMARGEASRQLEKYFNDVDAARKEQIGNRMRVSVHHFQIRRRSAMEYDIDWLETWTPTYGYGTKTLKVSGVFVIERRPEAGLLGMPKLTASLMNQSPMGVYVSHFSWAEEWMDGSR